MTYYDERLEQLEQQLLRKQQLERQLGELHTQKHSLTARLQELEACKRAEQADVDRLEGHTLAAFFCRLAGSRDEKLDQERQEAYAAAVKCDAAARALASVEEDIRRLEQERRSIQGTEQQYRQALAEKAEAVKAAACPEAGQLLILEQQICGLKAQQRELDEAQAAGHAALCMAERVLEQLDSAGGWGTWDLIGGGLVTDLIKYNQLDDAQQQVEQLQVALRRFKTELADVSIQEDMQVSVDGFLRFADYFFDGLFADWAVLDKIKRSSAQIQRTCAQLEMMLSRLEQLSASNMQQQAEANARRDKLVRQAAL